jgi:GPH family glycoside/pentoside/hexuronide:cation symporter
VPAENVLSLRKRAIYGIGGAVFSVKEAAYAVFVLLFYTQILGLSGTLTGIALFVAVVLDVVSDPIIGTWSDRLQSRWGRRHPFMIAGALPLGLGFLGLFNPPVDILDNQLALAVWLLFWTAWIRTSVSVYSIPQLALSADMSGDYQERSAIMSMRMFFVFLTTVLFPAIAIWLIFPESNGEDGRFDAANYSTYALWSCALVWLLASACIWGTREYAIPNDQQLPGEIARPGIYARLKETVSDFRSTLRNTNFKYLVGFEICAMISYGILIALNFLSWVYFWDLSAEDSSTLLAVPALVGVTAAMPAMRWLGGRMAKHRIIQITSLAICLDLAWVFGLRIWGWLPENDSSLVLWLLILQMMIFMFLFILRSISAYSLLVDIADEHDLQEGRRQEGALFAAFSFASKLASGIGPLYGGAVLDLIGLNRGMLPGTIDQNILDGLALATIVGTVIPLFFAWHFSNKVSLSEQRLQEIQTQLAQR